MDPLDSAMKTDKYKNKDYDFLLDYSLEDLKTALSDFQAMPLDTVKTLSSGGIVDVALEIKLERHLVCSVREITAFVEGVQEKHGDPAYYYVRKKLRI